MPGIGLGTIDQLVPSQDSINGSFVEALPEPPTAVQSMELMQETPLSELPEAPVGLGLGTMDQAVPLYDSVRVFVTDP